MDSREILVIANRQCADLTLPMLEDLATAPHLSPLSSGGNHAHWIAGHLLTSEGQFHSMMQGIANPVEDLKPLFGAGSVPAPDGQGYPEYQELLAKLKAAHEATMTWLEGLTECDLDQASRMIPPGMESFFGTWRQVLLVRSMHWMTHRGQLADCRKAAGRAPLMM
ncbi:MAG: DinB family protein [Planctomycetaceae bacterium]|nr:DinB family protein [Planctomycetaceae bacterium]